MKLYYSKGACSLAVRIILCELNLPFDSISVNLKTKKTEHNQDYLKINPKGSVPVLVTDEDEILTENMAILQFIADQFNATNLLPEIGNFLRYRVLELLSFIATDIHKAIGALFKPDLADSVKKDFFIPLLKNKIDILEKNLANKTYLMGNEFTLPDAYLFVILTWFKPLNIDMDQWNNMTRYFQTLKNKKSIEQAIQAEALTIG